MGAHALLVGVSQFDDPKLAKLNSPKSDVEAFASVLKDPARGGFDNVEVSIDSDLLTIRDQLSALMDGRSADDMVLLYYSGHGIVAKGGRLYLATGQSSFDKPQARSIATSEVRDLMEQSRAGRLVIILDCCHSGVFAEGAKGAEAPAMTDSTFGDASGAEGQYILTATDALQYAYDGTGALRESAPDPMLSRFTRWLVDGIGNGEASPFDEEITLDALYQYLCRRARTEQVGMTPQRFVKRGSGEMVIAKNPAGKQLALPDDLVAKLDSPDWRVRKDAVAELGKLAKQPNMVALVKKAVLDRVSIDRDVDVREAMVRLMQQLGLARPDPEPQPFVQPEPKPAPRPTPAPPPPQPQSIPLPALDDWQTKVLVKSGVATAALTAPNGPYLLMELQRRANALRSATYMHRTYIAGAIFFALIAIGQLQEGTDQARGAAFSLLVMVGFGIAGLLNRKTVPAGPSASGDTDMKRLEQAVPMVESWWGWGWGKRDYEATLFRRSCWWMVGGGIFAFFVILTQI
ncbi:MAG TPA: caspase family protein [Micropepsaceae bacterium]|nr:caspase family protein [Micropepsaceae bacterium]